MAKLAKISPGENVYVHGTCIVKCKALNDGYLCTKLILGTDKFLC